MVIEKVWNGPSPEDHNHGLPQPFDQQAYDFFSHKASPGVYIQDHYVELMPGPYEGPHHVPQSRVGVKDGGCSHHRVSGFFEMFGKDHPLGGYVTGVLSHHGPHKDQPGLWTLFRGFLWSHADTFRDSP